MHAAVGRFDGSVTVLKPFETGADGRHNPSYRDLFPEPPPAGLVPSCAEAGVLGALTGVIGTLQAMEAIKLITGIGEPLVGRLLLYDALAARFDTVRLFQRRSSEAEHRTVTLVLSAHEQAIAAGASGEGAAMAMRIVAESARLLGAPRLIPIASAHIDGALYHGDSGTLFAERLVEGGAQASPCARRSMSARST